MKEFASAAWLALSGWCIWRFMSFKLEGLRKNKWVILFGIWAIHGLTAFWQLLYSPFINLHDLSIKPVLLLGFALLFIGANLVLIFWVFRNTARRSLILGFISKPLLKDFLWGVSVTILSFTVFLKYFKGVISQDLISIYGGYLEILSPIFDLMIYVFLEIILLFLLNAFRVGSVYKENIFRFLRIFLMVLSGLVIIASVISFTGLGITPIYNKGDWMRGLPTVPLLEWQIALAGSVCLGMILFERHKKLMNFPYFDVLVSIFIWLGVSFLWLSHPIVPNPSALTPRQPNFEVYPFIDSQTYDEFAQSVLVGNGFGEDRIPQRPLYIVFLVFLHKIMGQKYDAVIFAQSLVFALFPVLLYWLGKEFFGRPLGGSVALLAALRDYTSNLVAPFTGNLSYSKLYLSEIPTAMLLAFFLLIGLRWLKAGFPVRSSLLLGGVLGTAMLIRTQVIVALPVLLFFGFLTQREKYIELLKKTLLMIVLITLVIAPWLWRNWHLTGKLMFDSPESQTANLALRYSRLNEVEPEILPFSGESNVEYTARLKKIAFDAISSNPWGAAKGVLSSFLNHCINNILVFPLRNELHSLDELWTPDHPFWEEWNGTPNFSQKGMLLFYLVLFGLGVSIACYRNGWLGLLPLALNLGYNLWTSLALLSGQRFMLTMDWSVYLYYMLGVFVLLGVFLYVLHSGRALIVQWMGNNQTLTSHFSTNSNWKKIVVAVIIFLGIGFSLPLIERSFVNRYPLLSQGELINKLLNSPALSTSESACLQKISDDEDLYLVQGRALYPRYYSSGDGEDFTDSIGYKATDVGRLVFNILGQEDYRVIFPMSQSPEFFPNISDVTLLYDEDLIFIFVEKDGVEKLYTSESFDVSLCKRK